MVVSNLIYVLAILFISETISVQTTGEIDPQPNCIDLDDTKGNFKMNEEKLSFSKATEWCQDEGMQLYYPKTQQEDLHPLTAEQLEDGVKYWIDGKRHCGDYAQWKTETGSLDGCLVVRQEENTNEVYTTSCSKKYRALCADQKMSQKLMTSKSAINYCRKTVKDRQGIDNAEGEYHDESDPKDDFYEEEEEEEEDIDWENYVYVPPDNSYLYISTTLKHPVQLLPSEQNPETYWIDPKQSCGKNFPFFNKKDQDISPLLKNKWYTYNVEGARNESCLKTEKVDGSYLFSPKAYCDDKILALCTNAEVSTEEMIYSDASEWCSSHGSALYYPKSPNDPVPEPKLKRAFGGIKDLFEAPPSYWVDGHYALDPEQWFTSKGEDITSNLAERWKFNTEPLVEKDQHCLRSLAQGSTLKVDTAICEDSLPFGNRALCMQA